MSANAHGAAPYYFVPQPSHWPMVGSIALLGFGLGMAGTINGVPFAPYVLAFGFADGAAQFVDDGVADHMDAIGRDTLVQQMLTRARRRREMPASDGGDAATERLLRKRTQRVGRAQPRFDMCEGDAGIARCQGAGIGRGSVALDDDEIGTLRGDLRAHVCPQVAERVRQRAARRNRRKFAVGRQLDVGQRRADHGRMLAAADQFDPATRVGPRRTHQSGQLQAFRSRTGKDEDAQGSRRGHGGGFKGRRS